MSSLTSTPRRSLSSLFARLLATRTGRAPAPAAFEALESRQLLANSPLPTIADLESPNNTVVRIETNYGDFDIELFNSAAPITVANFLNYVTSGRFDETFFHRSAFNQDSSPFVLQGGGFSFDDVAGLSTVTTDAAIIRENTGRQNDARTVAMARTGAINSATSQFFINYVDNDFLNPTGPNDGYAVFGRIVTGWSVIQTIQGLAHPDLTTQPKFAGSQSSNFSTVPVNAGFSSSAGVREQDLVNIVNAEIIKPASVAGFFTQSINYPEGFRSTTSIETITLNNTNNQAANYQVIVHYETGLRDVVIASGSIAGNTSLNIAVSDFNQAGLNLVRANTPYSIEVQSAFAENISGTVKPVSATSSRNDFNSATSEDFYNPAAAPTGTTPMRTWDLPRIERNAQSREYLVYQNLSDATGTLTITVRHSGGTQTFTRTVEPYRRGGMELFSLGLPDGPMSIRVTSTVDVVVAMSDWDLPNTGVTNPSSAYTPGFGVLGIEGGGSTTGAIAFAKVQNNFSNIISIANMGAASANVTLSFFATSTSNPTAITRTITVGAGQRSDFQMTVADLGVADNATLSVTYASTSPVSVQYTSVDNVGRNQATGKKADGMATTFNTQVAPVLFFGGQLDPTNTNSNETISIFSPFADDAVTFTYTIRYHFSDGSTFDVNNTLGHRGRTDVATRNQAAVFAKINSNTQFRTYAIQVFGSGTNSDTSVTTPTAGIVTLSRTDTTNGRTVMTHGQYSAQGLRLTDAVFQPSI